MIAGVWHMNEVTASIYRFGLALLLIAAEGLSEDPRFADVTAVSIRYELTAHSSDETLEEIAEGYPHLLRVFLRIKNTHDADLTWVGNSVNDIEARLIDDQGQLVPTAPTFSSITDADRAMIIPSDSSLEWVISHLGMSMIGDRANSAAIMVGGQGWLIPLESLQKYSLAILVRGLPWARVADSRDMRQREVLFDIPATPIEIDTQPNRVQQPAIQGLDRYKGAQREISSSLVNRLESIISAILHEDYFRLYAYVASDVVDEINRMIRMSSKTLWGVNVDLREIIFSGHDHRYGIAVAIFEQTMSALSAIDDSWLNVLQINRSDIGLSGYNVISQSEDHIVLAAKLLGHTISFSLVLEESKWFVENINVNETFWREVEDR